MNFRDTVCHILQLAELLYTVVYSDDEGELQLKTTVEEPSLGELPLWLTISESRCTVNLFSALLHVEQSQRLQVLTAANAQQEQLLLPRIWIDRDDNLSACYTMVLYGSPRTMAEQLLVCLANFGREALLARGFVLSML